MISADHQFHRLKSSSSMSVSMEYVKYQPEHNPEAIISYCSNGIQTGRSKNQDVKDMILKAKKHLSAIGWSFIYVYKNQDRRELRYLSPAGRFYYSLRTACQSLVDQQGCYIDHVVEKDKEPGMKLEKREDCLGGNRPTKKIRMEDVESLYSEQEREQSFVNNDDGIVENVKIESIRLREGKRIMKSGALRCEKVKEPEEKLEKIGDCLGYNRPKKVIRMEDVENSYFRQESDQSFVNNDHCIIENLKIEGTNLREGKRIVKSGSFGCEKVKEPEEKLGKTDDFLGYNRPKKKIRMEDVENSYFEQQREQSIVNNNPRVQDFKSFMKFSEKKIDFKPRKVILKAEGSGSGSSSSMRRRCVLSLLIVKNILLRGSNVSYRKKDGRVLAKGRVYDEGIQCDCCDEFFLLSKFEAHAGSTYRRPAANIFLDDGRSIFDCQTQLQLENKLFMTTTLTKSTDNVTSNDDFCSFCNDGGALVLCDSCTSSFHATCIGLSEIPNSAYWFCHSCCCRICHEGQISNFTMEDNNERDQIKCGLCERLFHIDCVTNLGFLVSKSDSDKWLCSESCERIFSTLNAILGNSIRLSVDNLSWKLLKLDTDENNTYECTETYSKLNVALDVMHECFQPVKHRCLDNDLLDDLIFSRSSKRPNFKGFYTAVLERDDEMITVATLRIHGCKAAEIPLVATRFRYRRSGMCRILMDEIERKLGELGVERLVLPAVPEMISTWTESFGFSVMTELERLDLVGYKFLDFPGTIRCHKILK